MLILDMVMNWLNDKKTKYLTWKTSFLTMMKFFLFYDSK